MLSAILKTTFLISTILVLQGCSNPKVDKDFHFRHPNCKFISAESGDGDLAVVYIHIDYLKPNSNKKTSEVWQYWNLSEGWTHREQHLLNDTINSKDVSVRTNALIGKWKDGGNIPKRQWVFQKDHSFVYDDEKKTINGVWFLDLSKDITLYHHSVLNKPTNSKELIDEVYPLTYETKGDTVWFYNKKTADNR